MPRLAYWKYALVPVQPREEEENKQRDKTKEEGCLEARLVNCQRDGPATMDASSQW